MTKPIAAVAALILVEERLLRLDDPVDALLPELADRRVLVDARGPIDGRPCSRTPDHRARRPDVPHGTRHGLPRAVPAAAHGGDGRPRDRHRPARTRRSRPNPTSGCAGSATLPLLHQPGARWPYHHSADILGVLSRAPQEAVRRVAARAHLRAARHARHRVRVPTDVARLGSSYERDPEPARPSWPIRPEVSGPRHPRSRRAAGDWCRPSTISTPSAACCSRRRPFARRRSPHSRAAVAAMTVDQLDVAGGALGPTPDRSQGWGFGVGVQVRRTGLGPTVGTYGWTGGLGSSWGERPQPRCRRHHPHHRRVRRRVPAARGHLRLLDRRVRRARLMLSD